MNTKNNRRRRESVARIETAFMELLQTRDLKAVTVADLCKMTGLNRSTFYANFLDIYDLADKLRTKLEADFAAQLGDDPFHDRVTSALRMFRHIAENQLFYKTYFKLGYDEQHPVQIYDLERAEQDFGETDLKYHIEFFRHGLNAILKLWLDGGCKETPEEMNGILLAEYQGRSQKAGPAQ